MLKMRFLSKSRHLFLIKTGPILSGTDASAYKTQFVKKVKFLIHCQIVILWKQFILAWFVEI